MSTAEVIFERRVFSRVVSIVFAEDEMPPTAGDRKRGSHDRREARVVSVRLAFYWSFEKQQWVPEAMASAQVEQRLADGGWSDAKQRNIWPNDDNGWLYKLQAQHTPQTTLTIVEE